MQPRRTRREPGGGVGPHPGGAALAHIGRGEARWLGRGGRSRRRRRGEARRGDARAARQRPSSSGSSRSSSAGAPWPVRMAIHVGRLAGWRAVPVVEIRACRRRSRDHRCGQGVKDPEAGACSRRRGRADGREPLTPRAHGRRSPPTPGVLDRANHADIGVTVRVADARVTPASRARRRPSGRAARVRYACSSPRPLRAVNRGIDDGQASRLSHSCGIPSFSSERRSWAARASSERLGPAAPSRQVWSFIGPSSP